MPRDPQRFETALRRFDEENSRDPNQEIVDGVAFPRELIYARWLTAWVLKLCPEASEELRLAARCQHLCRWMVPRSSYPMTRAGYLQWREGLKKFHAQKAGEIDPTRNARALARFLTSSAQGLSVMAKAFPERAVLEDIVGVVLAALESRRIPWAKSST